MHARLSALMFLMFAVLGCWVPMFSVRLHELGFSPLDIAWASATAAMSYLAAPLLAGQVADRWFPAERCVAVGSLAAGGLLWYVADLREPGAVFWTIFAFWLIMVPVVTIGNALTFTHLDDPARHFGKIRVWGTLGWMGSAWLMGSWLWLGGREWLPLKTSLDDIFHLGAIWCGVLALYALTLPHTPPKRHGQGWLAPLQALTLLRERDFAVYVAGSLVLYATIPFNSQVTPLLLQSVGFARSELSALMTLGQTMEIGVLAVLPAVLGRLGVRGTMICGLSAWAAGLLAFAVGEPTWLVVAALTCNGVCVACFMVAGQVFLNSRAHGHIRASTQSLLVFVNGVGLLAGNVLAGWVRNLTAPAFGPTFATAAALAVALVLFFLVGFPRAAAAEEEEDLAAPNPLACVEAAEHLQ